jgi:hypothetical protein
VTVRKKSGGEEFRRHFVEFREGGKMLRGEIPLTSTRPINP